MGLWIPHGYSLGKHRPRLLPGLSLEPQRDQAWRAVVAEDSLAPRAHFANNTLIFSRGTIAPCLPPVGEALSIKSPHPPLKDRQEP